MDVVSFGGFGGAVVFALLDVLLVSVLLLGGRRDVIGVVVRR